VGKREARLCDFGDGTCGYLARGACVLCERDFCHEQHSFLRDKFIPSTSDIDSGAALSLTFALLHVEPNSHTVAPNGAPGKLRTLICLDCGHEIRGGLTIRDAVDAAMAALVKSLRGSLTQAALKKG
jgi:hypothetical protein